MHGCLVGALACKGTTEQERRVNYMDLTSHTRDSHHQVPSATHIRGPRGVQVGHGGRQVIGGSQEAPGEREMVEKKLRASGPRAPVLCPRAIGDCFWGMLHDDHFLTAQAALSQLSTAARETTAAFLDTATSCTRNVSGALL